MPPQSGASSCTLARLHPERERDMRVGFGGRAALAAAALCCAWAAPAHAAGTKVQPLNQYVVTGGDRSKLAAEGFDVVEGRSAKGGEQGIVATAEQADSLRAQGFTVTAPYGEVKRAFAPPNPFPATKLDYGYDVYRPWRVTPGGWPNAGGGATRGHGQPGNPETRERGQG